MHLRREVADITLSDGDLSSIVSLVKLSRALSQRLDGSFYQVMGLNSAFLAAGIAGAVTPQASSLLLCDEPTGALDYHTSKEILELMEQVNREYGCTIVIVTHNDAIKHMAHRILRLRDGRLVGNEINPTVLPARELTW